jgi:hypothetical protein
MALALASTTSAMDKGAAREHALSFVLPTDSPIALNFEVAGDRTLASAVVVIGNQSAVDLTITLSIIDSTDGSLFKSTDADSTLRLTVNGAVSATVAARSLLAAIVGVDGPSDLAALSGLLVAETTEPGVAPATIPIDAAFPNDAERFAGARVEPSEISVTMTRSLPGIFKWDAGCWSWPPLGSDALRVSLADLGSPIAPGTVVRLPETLLASDTGGRMFARLGMPNGFPKGDAWLELGCPARSGTYSGSLPFEVGNDEASTLSLTVKVQDLFIYPLMAVFAGAGLAYLLRRRSDDTRPRALLRDELKKARSRYVAARMKYGEADRTILDRIFDPVNELPGGQSEAAKLFQLIAAADSKEDLDAATKAAADLIEAGDLIDALVEARTGLRDQLEGELSSVTEAAALRKAGSDLLQSVEITSLDDLNAHLDAVREQTRANVYWARAFRLYRLVLEKYQRLSETLPAWIDDRARLADPTAISEAYLRPARTIQDLEDPDVLGMLRERMGIIEVALRAAPRSDGAPPPGGSLGALLASVVMPAMPDRITPDRRIEWLWLGDVIEFWIVAAIAAAAFLGTAYVDQAFGSTWQYLAAFVTGAAGTLAVNFTLLPWYRSYRVARTSEG